jgi:hypothetical protein
MLEKPVANLASSFQFTHLVSAAALMPTAGQIDLLAQLLQ